MNQEDTDANHGRAEYSKELSVKIAAAHRRMAEPGYDVGGVCSQYSQGVHSPVVPPGLCRTIFQNFPPA